ncbi:MAG: pilus assembly protein N-terminal domain-containing protein, partial [Henriciella sp.]
MRAELILKASALALTLGLCPMAASAQNLMGVRTIEPGDSNVTKIVKLGKDKSMVIELDRPAADIVITNPAIADATVQTAKRIIFRGIESGQTNAFIFDRDGNP